MKPIAYAMQFRGQAVLVSPGVLKATTVAPSSSLVTTVGRDGVKAALDAVDGAEATFESEVRFSDDRTFQEDGTITFGDGNRLRFHTVGDGNLGESPDPHLKHGTVMWEVESGEGQFAGARGRITSNFFVSDSGDVTDNHFGVIFVS